MKRRMQRPNTFVIVADPEKKPGIPKRTSVGLIVHFPNQIVWNACFCFFCFFVLFHFSRNVLSACRVHWPRLHVVISSFDGNYESEHVCKSNFKKIDTWGQHVFLTKNTKIFSRGPILRNLRTGDPNKVFIIYN